MRFTLVILGIYSSLLFAEPDNEPSLEFGAGVYDKRCVLCHGENGRGDGKLPALIADYPSTNLHRSNNIDRKRLKQIILFGGLLEEIDPRMPPWLEELSWRELESVTMYVEYMLKNPGESLQLLQAGKQEAMNVDVKEGKILYGQSCSLCHGATGDGQGKMAQLITNPPPFDLRQSKFSREQLINIVGNGGESEGRSSNMPAWKDRYTMTQIKQIAEYVMSIREE